MTLKLSKVKKKIQSVEQIIKDIAEQGVLEAIGDAVSIQDTDFRILYQNQAHKDIIGDHFGKHCYEAYERRKFVCEACPIAMTFEDGGVHTQERSAPTDAGTITVEITASPLRDKKGKIVAGIEVARDITQKIELHDQLRALTLTDELTGLYNRRGFMTLAEQQLKVANRLKTGVLLLFADVNDLKRINDEHGHREGDAVLRETAEVLKNAFRESDIIARIGGDEFVVFPVEITDTSATALNQRFHKHFDDYNANSGRDYEVGMSIGIVTYEQGCPYSIEELLDQADRLMYEKKKLRESKSGAGDFANKN